MRIRIHPHMPDGTTICGVGPVVEAPDPTGLVEAMHQETAFTRERPLADWMADVLARVHQPDPPPELPANPDAAAVEFLTILAKMGRIAFLPDKGPQDAPEAQPATTMEDGPCAAKQA